jgi:diacylglycerol kinase family enzyme
MKIKAIFNRDGGTFRTTDMEAYRQKAEEVFRAAGHDIEIAIVSGSEMGDTLEKAARRDDLDAMIAGGGDGTISGAAGVAWKNGMPLGVVPAGTMNLFAISAALTVVPSYTSFPWGCMPAWCAIANHTASPHGSGKSARPFARRSA